MPINLNNKLVNSSLAFVLLALFWAFQIQAQSVIQADSTDFFEAELEQISINQGLSQGMINKLEKDELGYIWAATQDGLNRYDGTGFKVFRHNAKDSTSIAGNFIQCIFIDSKNRLWVTVPPFGLDLFDRETETFIHFRHNPKDPNTINSDVLKRISEDPSGNILVMAPWKEFNCLSQKSGTKGKSVSDFLVRPYSKIMPMIRMVVPNFEGDKWIRFAGKSSVWCMGNQLYYFLSIHTLPTPVTAPQNSVYDPLACSPGNHLIFDPDGIHVYRLDSPSQVSRFDEKTKAFIPYLKLPKGFQMCSRFWIDREHRLWCYQSPHKILRINLLDGNFTVIRTQTDKLDPAIRQSDFTLWFHDQNDNLWMGSSGLGLIKLSASNERFKRKTRVENSADFEPSLPRFANPQNHAFYDPVLAAFRKKLIYTTSPKRGNINDIHEQVMALNKKGQLIYILANLKNYETGLYEADPNTGISRLLGMRKLNRYQSFGLNYFLDRNDEIWLGERSSDDGVYLHHFNPKTGGFEKFRLTNEPSLAPACFVMDWHVTRENTFWLATRKGLIHFDPRTKAVQQFRNKPADERSIGADATLCICPDPDQPDRIFWIGTNGAGMDRFDKQSGTFTHFTTDNGLPNNVVYGIQTDGHKNLWLSTNLGLCLFNSRTKTSTNFSTKDGLLGNEFNKMEFAKASDGTLYFGGTNGFTWFQPEDFYKAVKPSPVVFNELRLMNKTVPYSNKKIQGFHLNKPIEQLEELVFTHEQSMITLGFALLDLSSPEINRFRYKMEGFDKDWIEAGTAHEATYTNLQPGDYTFKVLGCNSRKVWNTEPKTITITILPPWWGTWLFRTFSVFCLGSLLYGIYRYRLQQALNMMRLRDKIALDLHDEIGSSLNSIAFFGEAARRMLPEDTQANQVISRINDKSKEIMESMSDIVWSLNSRNDSFDNIFNRLRSFAIQILEPKGCEVHFELPEHLDDLKLGMEERKNLYLLVKEAINNAAKYAECSSLFVTMEKQKNSLHIEIRDNGKGFDVPGVLKGNGLLNMKKRAEELKASFTLDSNAGVGTRIVVELKNS